MRTPDADLANAQQWPTLRDWLAHRLSKHIDVDAFFADERFVDEAGHPIRINDAYRANTFVWFHRDLLPETPVPGKIRIVHRDERIVVVDKPPFLSSIPRGRHVMESVVVRMRAELGLRELTPMHRLDRVTSGLLLMATERRWRGAYQSMFMRGEVHKVYRAAAPIRNDLEFPVTVHDHLRKQRGVWQGEVVPGAEPNAESLVELERALPVGWSVSGAEAQTPETPHQGVYRLTPRTGKTHQLRLHMWGLGIPIAGDPLYPEVKDLAVDDFSTPLQLLASELRFTDPVDGSAREFRSSREFPIESAA